MEDQTPVPVPAPAERPKINFWTFLPLMYFMQAIPVVLVQGVAAIMFKDQGVENQEITRWIALIGLPWALQMLLGPLVEFNSTKRNWIVVGQFTIAVGICLTAFAQKLPHSFTISLVILGVTAITSALTNIAADGYYMILATKDEQARYVGVRTTCFRLGVLFCKSLLVVIAGLLISFTPLKLSVASPAGIALLPKTAEAEKNAEYVYRDTVSVVVEGGKLVDQATKMPIVVAPTGGRAGAVEAPPGTYGLRYDGRSLIAQTGGGEKNLGFLFTNGQTLPEKAESKSGMEPRLAWTFTFLVAAIVYGLGALWSSRATPKVHVPVEGNVNVFQIVSLVGLGLSGYFMMNALLRLTLHGLARGFGSEGLKGWLLPDNNLMLGFATFANPVAVEFSQLLLCAAIFLFLVFVARLTMKGSDLAASMEDFFKQPGIVSIFFFVLFYRFGEAMLTGMVPLFYKDVPSKGGLAVPNEVLGTIDGLAGVIGIILGGIVGGLFISKRGVRKSFWILAAAMYVPNLMYLWASIARPQPGALYFVAFIDQFGYGFGFAGYFVYLMWVAQRGKYQTAHYAIATGLGALTIAFAGALGGVVQANFGYTALFVVVLLVSIPGLVAMYSVPIDDSASSFATEAINEVD
ncbi:MAG: hypothetical protein JNJ45_04535 [Chthonomonas sp.]|nr:hypothetical protein [Chthonomonas sp.]